MRRISLPSQKMSELAASMLGKPETYVLATLEPEKPLFFGGTDAPAAYVTLDSIGLPEDRTTDFQKRSAAFSPPTSAFPATASTSRSATFNATCSAGMERRSELSNMQI